MRYSRSEEAILAFFPYWDPSTLKIRTQSDNRGDEVSQATGLACDPDDNMVRPEFADEANINILLARYGVVPGGRPTFGEVDYDLDLQGAYRVSQEAAEAFQRLDPRVRGRYTTWRDLLAAAERGELDLKPEAPAAAERGELDRKPEAPATPDAPPAS